MLVQPCPGEHLLHSLNIRTWWALAILPFTEPTRVCVLPPCMLPCMPNHPAGEATPHARLSILYAKPLSCLPASLLVLPCLGECLLNHLIIRLWLALAPHPLC